MLNCRRSGNFSKSFCQGFLVWVSLWQRSGHSGIDQHNKLCSSEVWESDRIAQDGSSLLPVIRHRVNHCVTVIGKYKCLSNFFNKSKYSVWKIHGFCTWIHKKMHTLEWAPEVWTSPSLPKHCCLHNHLHFCSSFFCPSSFTFVFFYRMSVLQKQSGQCPLVWWGGQSTLWKWGTSSGAPLLIAPKLFHFRSKPKGYHHCSWRWYFHQHLMASVVSLMWLQREKVLWCLHPKEDFRPQRPFEEAWGLWLGSTRCNTKVWC